jgi:hypothetical protein
VPADQPTIQDGINAASAGDNVLVDTERGLKTVKMVKMK